MATFNHRIKMGYSKKSALSPEKARWRGGNAEVYRQQIGSIPADGHALLMPAKFVKMGKVVVGSQPELWHTLGIAKPSQMVCVDKMQAVVTSNKKAPAFIHRKGMMSKIAPKYNPYIVDYDGMKTVKTEVEEVVPIMEHLNTLPHDCILTVNCSTKAGRTVGPTLRTKFGKDHTTFDEFKKYASFRSALRGTSHYKWTLISRPDLNLTSKTQMENFILLKRYTPKTDWKAAGKKAWKTRIKNGNV